MSPLQAQEKERRGLKVSKPPKITKTTGYECTGNDMLEHYAEIICIYKIKVNIYLTFKILIVLNAAASPVLSSLSITCVFNSNMYFDGSHSRTMEEFCSKGVKD